MVLRALLLHLPTLCKPCCSERWVPHACMATCRVCWAVALCACYTIALCAIQFCSPSCINAQHMEPACAAQEDSPLIKQLHGSGKTSQTTTHDGNLQLGSTLQHATHMIVGNVMCC